MARLAMARTPEELELGRELWREYAAVIRDPAWLPDFDAELRSLGETYAPPGGVFLLAWEGDELAGCGALRRLDAERCEMRRVFVRPPHRGRGLARTISVALLGEARRLGFAIVRLDVSPDMAEATKLYESLGFRTVPAYPGAPGDATCMEARVRSGPAR